SQLFEHFTFAGVYIAELVSRGYGLGGNFIIESMIYGHFGFLVMLVFLSAFLLVFKNAIKKIKPQTAIVFVCLAMVFIRIMVREGLPAAFGLFVFVSAFYIFPLMILDRIKYFKKSEV